MTSPPDRSVIGTWLMILRLALRKTIVLVTRRLTVVRDADRIFLLEGGRLMDARAFEEPIDRNPRFRELAAGAAQGAPQ